MDCTYQLDTFVKIRKISPFQVETVSCQNKLIPSSSHFHYTLENSQLYVAFLHKVISYLNILDYSY